MGRSSRRRGRESALQVLYQLDRDPQEAWDADRALADYFANFEHPEKVRDYVEQLVQGVVAHRAALDVSIESTSTRWRLARMSAVDRNLLRLGAYELAHCPEVPPGAAINEAVEIARRFGSETSPGFVNGILDELARRSAPRGSA